MKKIYFLILLTLPATFLYAQKSNYVTIHGGYGSENNMGYYGGFGGMGIEKPIKKKITLAADATYFSGKTEIRYTNSEDRYASAFLTPKVGYHLAGNQQSFFRLTFLAGPALKWYNYKWLSTSSIDVHPDGSETLVNPVYEEKKGLNLSFYSGVDLSFSISPKIKASAFLDTYSHDILLEHFMPGIKVGVQL